MNVIITIKHRNIIRSFISQIYEALRQGDCHRCDKKFSLTIYLGEMFSEKPLCSFQIVGSVDLNSHVICNHHAERDPIF